MPDVSVHVNVAVDVFDGSVRLTCRSCGRLPVTRCTVTQSLAESVERVRMFGSAALDLAFVAEGRTDACVILANKPSQAL
jgi:fructose-1,6-bisphosphatase/inositol monophosphatase family enzyme